MALDAEGEEDPETEVEARNVARANERWRAAAAALQLQECPTLEVPLLRMIPNKSQQSVAQALAAMIAHLRYEGFMLRRLHSDRGREFNNGLVQRLCRQRDLYQTFTQGDDPRQNGRVEGYHARLKGKTRTLLKASSADPRDWPYAMRTAQAAMWAKAMQRFGRSAWYPLPFGTRVKVRTRSWERYGDVWSDRVQDATVLAPSVETCKGHVVRTEAGTLMHTTAVFRGAVQPSPQPVVPASEPLHASTRLGPVPVSVEAGPEVPVQFPHSSPPPRRVRGKQSVARLTDTAPELHALSQAATALLACRPVPFRTAAALLVSSPDLWGCCTSAASPLERRRVVQVPAVWMVQAWGPYWGHHHHLADTVGCCPIERASCASPPGRQLDHAGSVFFSSSWPAYGPKEPEELLQLSASASLANHGAIHVGQQASASLFAAAHLVG